MSITFRCHACEASYTVNDVSAGKRIECKLCGQELVVPGVKVESKSIHDVRPKVEATKPVTEDTESDHRPSENRYERARVPVRDRREDDRSERRPSRRKRWRFECPYCGCTDYPERITKVSTAGWIVAVILLVTTCVFFFIGLMITETKTYCRNCGVRIGG